MSKALTQGKVIALNERNCGQIAYPGMKDGLFFHADALEGTTFAELKKGDKVIFELIESKKGPYATHVHRA